MLLVSEADLRGWLEKALSGDELAYRRFLEAAARIARGYLFNRGVRSPELEDLVQEALMSVHKAKHTFDRQSPVLPWLFAIIHYRWVDGCRAYAKRTELRDSLMREGSADSYSVNHEDRLLAEGLLATLPARDQEILRRLKIEGWSVKEIAADLDISESAVKIYAFRAIRSLRIKLGISSDEN